MVAPENATQVNTKRLPYFLERASISTSIFVIRERRCFHCDESYHLSIHSKLVGGCFGMLDFSEKKGNILYNRSTDHFILHLYAINAERKREREQQHFSRNCNVLRKNFNLFLLE